VSQTYRIEHSIDINASPAQVFKVWSRVSDWPLWDPDTRSASLQGPLMPGATGRLEPRKGRAVPMEVVGLVPDHRLDVRCKVLGSALNFDHVVEPRTSGCRVTHAAWFTGWLAPVLMATVGKDVNRGLPVTLASLKRFVEAGR
jgi:uncharacterized protein YndB with AHSA1/START domain